MHTDKVTTDSSAGSTRRDAVDGEVARRGSSKDLSQTSSQAIVSSQAPRHFGRERGRCLPYIFNVQTNKDFEQREKMFSV